MGKLPKDYLIIIHPDCDGHKTGMLIGLLIRSIQDIGSNLRNLEIRLCLQFPLKCLWQAVALYVEVSHIKYL